MIRVTVVEDVTGGTYATRIGKRCIYRFSVKTWRKTANHNTWVSREGNGKSQSCPCTCHKGIIKDWRYT